MENRPDLTEDTALQKKQLMELILAVRFSDLDRDQQACLKLLELCEQEGDTYGIAFAYAYLGDCLIGKNESVNASSNLLRAKELCEKYRFLDLLPNVCNWLGIYYEMQNDRQMAMHYYLDALEFAERNHDLFRQSILLNNIASQFQSCCNYEMAKEYYVKAMDRYNMLASPDNANPHYAQMTANIISACCRLLQLDDAERYLGLLEQAGPLAGNQNQLYLCELLIAAAKGDVEATRSSVDKLLVEMQQQPQNLQQFFETFLIVAESMIGLGEQAYARKLLTVLDNLCQEDEYGHRLKVQYIWMRFYQDFGTEEEKRKAYQQFYELRKLSDAILNRNLADGLLSKIKLREFAKKNEEMERAKEQLEDEIQLDELTQIYNRRSFRGLTEQAALDPQVHTLSLIMIDVDYFKQYNDTYGHARGDAALRTVANILRSISTENIRSFRYGGDEFVSMCKNMNAKEVERYVRTISGVLRKRQIPHSGSQCSSQLTLSIGYTVHTRDGVTPLDIVEMMVQADKALYRAKDQGRNCACSYSGSEKHE